jgi:hypothetical protein
MQSFQITEEGIARRIQLVLMDEMKYRKNRISDEWRLLETILVYESVKLEHKKLGRASSISIYQIISIMQKARGNPDFTYRVAKHCEALIFNSA